jgi:ribosomal protein S18 acetylase RimI-like enzyme
MNNKNYIIKKMDRAEIDIVIEWAAKEGWNPGLHDADCYNTADPNGFIIGMLGDEPIATISVIKYDEHFGFLGFYIVKPEYRGKGYGIQIWNAGLKYLAGINIGLDGVLAQQDNYKKSGFKLAYRNIRFEGVGDGKPYENPKIINLSTLPFESIDSYSRLFFPAQRSHFLKSWINQPDSYALGIMQNSKMAGYGVIRQCRSGYKIGPLIAENPVLAESLFLALKSKIKASEAIYIDTPEANQAAVKLAERHNMFVSFETARMYTGEIPDTPLDHLFGVTSFEIG